jgi:hypothetical protein
MSDGKGTEESMESTPLLPRWTSGKTKNLPIPPPTTIPMEQAAAWMVHNAYFYGDPNAYAADGVAEPLHHYNAYPIPQGYPGPQHLQQAHPFSPPQPYDYPAAYNPGQSGAPLPHLQQQRPPLSQRRGATRGNSPTNAVQGGFFSSVPLEDRDRLEIPDLVEIFSDNQPLLQQSGNGDGYGSTAPQSAIYNAPPRTSARSTRQRGARPGLPRTNSAGDFSKHPLKASPTAAHGHRRINSDGLRGAYRRQGSHEEMTHAAGNHRRQGSRGRSSSAGAGKLPTHRRGDSFTSMRSNASMGSVVSNISKSEFFGGIDDKGIVQLHYPFESTRLVMIDPEQPSLRCGHLYLDRGVDDYDQFEEYHRLTEGNDGIFAPLWESLDRPGTSLPAPRYMLAVDDSIYKRILGEISEAHSMPCGIFFCGHHEDVAQPSIAIAAVLVTIVFASLVYVAMFTGDMQL